jgi:hypothetical protein
VSPVLAGVLHTADAPSVGSVVISAFPAWSTATHSDLEGHETPLTPLPSMFAGVLQVADAPSAGSVVIVAVPPEKPPLSATHSDAGAHDIPVTPMKPKVIRTGALQVADAPSAGSLVVTAFPKLSDATHSELVGHEIALSPRAPVLVGALHVGDDAAGLVVVTAFPAWSTATHSSLVGHETPTRRFEPSTFVGALQVGEDAVGLVVIIAFPALSTATHSDVEAHETAARLLGLANGGWWSTRTGAAHDRPEAWAAPGAAADKATTAQLHASPISIRPPAPRPSSSVWELRGVSPSLVALAPAGLPRPCSHHYLTAY